MEAIKTPKEVSEFLKDYKSLYIANCQLEAILSTLRNKINEAVKYCDTHSDNEVAKEVNKILFMVSTDEI